MKKIIIMALVMVGFSTYSAEAQKVACAAPDGKVCKKGAGGVSCYKTKYAHNFKVCKGNYGYYVCCQEPNGTNSTFPALPVAGYKPYTDNGQYAMQQYDRSSENEMDMDDQLIPQSQSYVRYSANSVVSYSGYYPNKGRIKVCSNSNNVAEANKDAYKGCPTPAYDGKEKNMGRNVNFSNNNSSFPQPPISGNPQ